MATPYNELTRLYHEYATAARSVRPQIAILSFKDWQDEECPTFEQFHGPFRDKAASKGEKTVTTETTTTQAAAPKKDRPKGAKALVRDIYSADSNAAFSVKELAEKTDKNESAITTAISDLRSAKYCKPGEPLTLHKWADGKYRLTAEPKVEKAAPMQTAAAPATAGAASAEVMPQV